MLPRVVLHMAVSLDGRYDWFTPDIGLFYELAGNWHEDITLTGAATILAAEDELIASVAAGRASGVRGDDQGTGAGKRPLLVVPDSRGRISCWPALRVQPYWRDVYALCSRATPAEYLESLDEQGVGYFVAGDDHVDLRAALVHLRERFGAEMVRADSGGTLNGARCGPVWSTRSACWSARCWSAAAARVVLQRARSRVGRRAHRLAADRRRDARTTTCGCATRSRAD